MTATQIVTALPIDPAVDATVVTKMLALVDGKGMTFGEALDAVLSGSVKVAPATPDAVKPQPLTDEQRKALATIPEIYGKVAPSFPRRLTKDEAKAIVEERAVIDTVLAVLTARKDKSIRETLANHLDRAAERDALTDGTTTKDSNGHYALKQDDPVPGTSLKIQRSVTDPKAMVSSSLLRDLHISGGLTREEYLSITSVPEVNRTFDEAKARKAIKANPALLRKIAAATTKNPKSTTIKVAPNRG